MYLYLLDGRAGVASEPEVPRSVGLPLREEDVGAGRAGNLRRRARGPAFSQVARSPFLATRKLGFPRNTRQHFEKLPHLLAFYFESQVERFDEKSENAPTEGAACSPLVHAENDRRLSLA